MEGVESPTGKRVRQKKAACLLCRRSKTKCVRDNEDRPCRKCSAGSEECVVPEYHVGRYKGVKNKRSGLEKAISQVEQALKRSRTSQKGEQSIDVDQVMVLEQLLHETTSTPVLHQPTTASVDNDELTQHKKSSREQLEDQHHSRSGSDTPLSVIDDAGDVPFRNVDNPLQLLALASAAPESSRSLEVSAALDVPSTISYGEGLTSKDKKDFFSPLVSHLDIGPEMDPINLGLVTKNEAERLFDFFHSSLAHTRWGMDPYLHTAAFVRSRSSYLFTSVMAASALFLPDTAALSKRLTNHVNNLKSSVLMNRYRSTEIVLALMVNVPWMPPGRTRAADDHTCYHVSIALTIALDLSLNRIIVPCSSPRSPGFEQRLTNTESIQASKALKLEGFEQVSPSSDLAHRLLRTRERVWLALFNLDRGMCLARGRPPTVPVTLSIRSCDAWHISDYVEKQDGALVSSTVLRRDFAALVDEIRASCDRDQLKLGDGSLQVRLVRERIETFFKDWQKTWKTQLPLVNGKEPPYIEILFSHTKLSAYCSVVNHPTASPEVKRFFRAAGLTSALNVIRTAVRSESRLRSMPNNTAIMVTFAACFVLGLQNTTIAERSLMASNTQILIRDVADVLERIGSFPEHRNGTSAVFGRHIKSIVRRSATNVSERLTSQGQQTSQNRQDDTALLHNPISLLDNDSAALYEGLDTDFSMLSGDFPVLDMTDDQILEAITHTGEQIDMDPSLQYDQNSFFDWLEDWG